MTVIYFWCVQSYTKCTCDCLHSRIKCWTLFHSFYGIIDGSAGYDVLNLLSQWWWWKRLKYRYHDRTSYNVHAYWFVSVKYLEYFCIMSVIEELFLTGLVILRISSIMYVLGMWRWHFIHEGSVCNLCSSDMCFLVEIHTIYKTNDELGPWVFLLICTECSPCWVETLLHRNILYYHYWSMTHWIFG